MKRCSLKKMKVLKVISMIERLLVISFLTMLTACSTVVGVGQDIAASANWAKQKITGPSKTNNDQASPAPPSDTASTSKDAVEIGAPMK